MKLLTHAAVSILLLCIILTGCRDDSDAVAIPEAVQGVERATMEDGVQVARVKLSEAGYQPTQIILEEDVPARLIFHRTVDAECAEQVQIPEMGIETTDLPLNEDVIIEFTPREAGRFKFLCGMEMLKGTLIVHS